MIAIALAAAAAVPRLLGGMWALRPDRLHVALGFAGGALLGVAAFETIPEALRLAPGAGWPLVLVLAALGAAAFAALERVAFGHVHTRDPACNPAAGHMGAGGITGHAFLDGLAIGAAFQAGTGVGAVVAAAVLLHAFADGLNTVTVVMRHGGARAVALAWLGADIAAPVAGAALGLFVSLPDGALAGLLAFFAGMFVYLGAGSLLPEAHRSGRDRTLVSGAALAGAALAFTAARLA